MPRWSNDGVDGHPSNLGLSATFTIEAEPAADVGDPVGASDEDMDELAYSLSGTDAASFDIDGDDGNGGTASINVTITVTDVNEEPTVARMIGDRTLASSVASLVIDLSVYSSDPDAGDTLIYSAASSDTMVATADVSVSDLTLTAVSAGTSAITVTAADRAVWPRRPTRWIGAAFQTSRRRLRSYRDRCGSGPASFGSPPITPIKSIIPRD